MAKRIKVNIFDDMGETLLDAEAYERGEAVNLRVTRIPARPKPISAKEVREIRQALHASQALFATTSSDSECRAELGAGHAPSCVKRTVALAAAAGMELPV